MGNNLYTSLTCGTYNIQLPYVVRRSFRRSSGLHPRDDLVDCNLVDVVRSVLIAVMLLLQVRGDREKTVLDGCSSRTRGDLTFEIDHRPFRIILVVFFDQITKVF